MTERVLITGANRGLGLEFVRQYLADGWHVEACCRAPENATELAALVQNHRDRLRLHPLDVTNAAQIHALAAALAETTLDLLINNAGVYGPRGVALGNIDVDAFSRVLAVNTIAPLKITEALADRMTASKRKCIAMVSSKMGSIADNGSGGAYIYRSSKAALNAIVKSLSLDLADRGIAVVVLHPGWVKTDMGGSGAMLAIPDSVTQMRRVLDGVNSSDSGGFFDRDGSQIPW